MRRHRYNVTNVVVGLSVSLICVFLILPTLAVIPLSFTSTDFITFPPKGFSLRWYEVFFTSGSWRTATANSLIVAVLTTILATVLGTMIAVALRGLAARHVRVVMWFVLLPMVVPTIVTAVALYSSFSRVGLVGTHAGLVIAHTIYALPFVVINVSAVSQKVDWRIVSAARSLGCGPMRAFWKALLPAILPGVVAGGIFAFLTSFDEIVIALFLSGANAVTLPVQMWSGIRFEISPAVAAASCILLVISLILLVIFQIISRLRK